MTDAQLIREFVGRQQRWLETLQTLKEFHHVQLGKKTAPVQWIAGRELGRYSWFGYYWPHEVFWFGYGLSEGIWCPLIEADNRSAYRELWGSMRTHLAGTWELVEAERNLYSRLWAPTHVAGAAESELEWFRARSRELHEFIVQPETQV